MENNSIKTATILGQLLKEKNLVVATAESCTGGLVASKITDISGSSEFFKEGYVTYANDIKNKNLGVSEKTLATFGAVSQECATEMAEGLMARTGCDLAICTTGIAGPSGGSPEKPVGLVFVGIKYRENLQVKEFRFDPKTDRVLMKQLFAEAALKMAIEILGKN